MRGVVGLLLIAGCGRISFESTNAASSLPDGNIPGDDGQDGSPDPMRFYGSTNRRLFVMDPATFQGTPILDLCPNLPAVTLSDIAIASSGALYGFGLADTGFYAIDRTTGACTRIATLGPRMFGATFLPPGVMGTNETLVGAGDDSNFYVVDVAGTVQLVGAIGAMPSGDLAWTGTELFLTVRGGAQDRLKQISLATGAGTDAGSLGFNVVNGLAWFGGKLYGLSNAGESFEIDPATAATVNGAASGQAWTGAATGP